jgi:hypothetical protein
MSEFTDHFARLDDIRLFEMTHAGHAIRREEHPFREADRFDEMPELAGGPASSSSGCAVPAATPKSSSTELREAEWWPPYTLARNTDQLGE